MVKHSVLGRVPVSNRLPRNAFDLSFRRMFTADAGELLPIYVEHCNPNEHFRINVQSFLRTQTLNTAAYTRMKQNCDFFFVPYRVLSKVFTQNLMNTDFGNSSAVQGVASKSLPLFNVGSSIQWPNQSAPSLTDVAKIWPVSSFATKTSSGLVTGNGNPLFDADSKDGNFITDMFGFDQSLKASRLFELLGYGYNNNSDNVSVVSATGSDKVFAGTANCLNYFAYEKIYNDMYRNPLYEDDLFELYNFDDFYLNTNNLNQNSIISKKYYQLQSGEYLLDLDYINSTFPYAFSIRYKNWKKDYFTFVRPEFAGAEFLTSPVSAPVFPNLPNSGDIEALVADSSISQAGFATREDSQTGNDVLDRNLTISNLRAAYALDKLLFNMQNARDGSYNEQVKNRFGFNPNWNSDKVEFLGSVDAPITISDVEGTATTEKSSLAQIAGKGVSMNSDGSFEFDTKEHGVIMGIFYVEPIADYADFGINAFNLKTSTSDFYQPEFEDLGYQPLTAKELTYSSVNGDGNTIIGYVPRYSEYKTRVDRIDGEFLDDLNSWVTPRSLTGVTNSSNGSVSLGFLKINPHSLDNIFAVVADGSSNQFLVHSNFNVQAVRPMSIFGSPYSNI